MENQKSNNKKQLIRDVIIKPRTPKWERSYLEKKQAEEYLMICRDGACHSAVKRVKKARHFMKWAVKLIVPDFLIGHPNLWDNASSEKYCYSDTESNCTSDGGLYQWGEAMQYAASCNGTGEGSEACATPVQGICPTSWHIPTHY